jgi:hypothetical protein
MIEKPAQRRAGLNCAGFGGVLSVASLPLDAWAMYKVRIGANSLKYEPSVP